MTEAKTAILIFPHQLFEAHPCINERNEVFLTEEFLFFRQYNFHKAKLLLHRASMKFYADFLQKKGIKLTYINTTEENNDIRKLISFLAGKRFTCLQMGSVHDDWLQQRIISSCKRHKMEYRFISTPYFLNDAEDTDNYFNTKSVYFQTAFYKQQREDRNLLVKADGEPEGGKWSFDDENRKKYPKQLRAPIINYPKENDYVKEARAYIELNFKNNYGSLDKFHFPTTFAEAQIWLEDFLEQRFELFGDYEDAIVAGEKILHHSSISLLLNNGLLTPAQVLTEIFKVKNKIPINSFEGFLRQLIGWREFVHIVYRREGKHQRTMNFWGFTRKIPASFWKGKTGIEPIDLTIEKILETGYCHHIERLMVLGNFMLLCEFDPDEVYCWFMELFIDSYDWVMVPNVYGMTQFADGGMMTTKPYISGIIY